MRIGFYFIFILMLGSLFSYSSTALATDQKYNHEPIQPITGLSGLDLKRIELGKKLFHDVRLSKNEKLSCASCHEIHTSGTLNTAYPVAGVSGKAISINVPTVWGSALNFTQFWDGRAATLEEQISGPILNPDEMGNSWPEIIAKLKMIPEYKQAFLEIYKSPPTEKNIKDAIATYERFLIPVNAPFDKYLLGEESAISADAKAGYRLFKDLGCSSCHQGANVGGNMFQKFGIVGDYFMDRGHLTSGDYGRFNVTKKEEDRYVFKVPSLRNVAKTAPYFHDGSAATLEEAVDVMAKYQLGRTLSQDERRKLVEFLKSLTGTLPVLE